MNTLELRAAVLPDGMTAETFDPWHCVFIEFKGGKNWQVTDTEQRRLHNVTHEWTDTVLPHLYQFKTRGEALLAARRHLYTGHVGGKMWSDGDPTAAQLLLDIQRNLSALSVAGTQPRPSEVVNGHRQEMEAYLKKTSKSTDMRAYPEEFSKAAILTVPAIDRLMKNIDRDMAALRKLDYSMGKLDEMWRMLTSALNAEGFQYTTMTRHIRRCLPQEYMEESEVSTVAGLMTPEQAYLLLAAYEEGVEAKHIAGLSSEFTRENLDDLKELIDSLPEEYLNAAYRPGVLSGNVRD